MTHTLPSVIQTLKLTYEIKRDRTAFFWMSWHTHTPPFSNTFIRKIWLPLEIALYHLTSQMKPNQSTPKLEIKNISQETHTRDFFFHPNQPTGPILMSPKKKKGGILLHPAYDGESKELYNNRKKKKLEA